MHTHTCKPLGNITWHEILGVSVPLSIPSSASPPSPALPKGTRQTEADGGRLEVKQGLI